MLNLNKFQETNLRHHKDIPGKKDKGITVENSFSRNCIRAAHLWSDQPREDKLDKSTEENLNIDKSPLYFPNSPKYEGTTHTDYSTWNMEQQEQAPMISCDIIK